MLLITAVSGNLQAQCNETVHYTEDFNGQDFLLSSGTDNAGDAIDNCWSRNQGSEISNYFWGTQNTSLDSGNTGPVQDNTSCSGNYLYVKENNGNVSSVATFPSPSIDISGLNYAELRFFYHMFGNNIDNLSIKLSDSSGFTQQDVLSELQQLASSDPFLVHKTPQDFTEICNNYPGFWNSSENSPILALPHNAHKLLAFKFINTSCNTIWNNIIPDKSNASVFCNTTRYLNDEAGELIIDNQTLRRINYKLNFLEILDVKKEIKFKTIKHRAKQLITLVFKSRKLLSKCII